jgi:small subunit ribosomal protein S20
LKRKRQSEKRRQHNQAITSRLRTLAKQATSPQTLRTAIAALDKAANAGVIQRNTAARRKSRLVRRLAREQAAPA